MIAISGMLAADAGAAERAPAAVEISFATHAGEGAGGRKLILRNGCYQVESGGSTGGAGYARDSEAGCHRAADVTAVFARLGAMGSDALVREADAAGGAARGAPRGGPGATETRVVLVRPDGGRWIAASASTGDEILRAVNELPGESQWDATPPQTPIGKGPQLVVLSAAAPRRDGSVRVEASLASDGRWWCHRSVIGPRQGADPALPAKKPSPITDAPARLQRILAGASARVGDEAREVGRRSDGREISVEVVWPGRAREPLRPGGLSATAAHRFGAEMAVLSSACDVK